VEATKFAWASGPTHCSRAVLIGTQWLTPAEKKSDRELYGRQNKLLLYGIGLILINGASAQLLYNVRFKPYEDAQWVT